jgi:hypothetical protein
MAMNLEFLCRYLGHHRMRDMIQFNGAEKRYESVCKRCGVKMIKTREGPWIELNKPGVAASPPTN